jgi:hypothetical protein
MGTRSRIAVKLEDNTIKSVYCHWDGYPSYVGRMLFKHHNNKESALKIIELGDLSSLAESLEKPEDHSFESPKEGYSVFYGRDRGETGIKAQTNHVFNGLITTANKCDAEWVYLFDIEKNKWFFVDAKRANNTKSKDRVNMWTELTEKNTEE